jgi:outer membrane protein OmpA-like peptidoglycan-associated protein
MKRSLLAFVILPAALVLTACGREYPVPTLPDTLFDASTEQRGSVLGPSIARGLGSYDFQAAERHEVFLFDTAKHELTPEHAERLDALAKDLDSLNDYEITVAGHTDSFGKDEDNESLSQRRVESVVGYLANKSVPVAKISVKALGERKPPVGGNSDWRHAQNRRVEVTVTPVR